MPNCDKLLRQARNAPDDLRFTEACHLAECYGFVLARSKGSHRIYKAPGQKNLINLQELNGKAKGYQVKQILAIIEELELQSTSSEEQTDG